MAHQQTSNAIINPIRNLLLLALLAAIANCALADQNSAAKELDYAPLNSPQQQAFIASQVQNAIRAEDEEDNEDDDIDEPAENPRLLTQQTAARHQLIADQAGDDRRLLPASDSYSESQKSERETDDLEKFFDTHLGPDSPEQQPASESRQRAVAVKLPSPGNRQFEVATGASSPLATIIHSLLTGRRPTITVETDDVGSSDESPKSTSSKSQAASASTSEESSDFERPTSSSPVEYTAVPVRQVGYAQVPLTASQAQAYQPAAPTAAYYYAASPVVQPVSSASANTNQASSEDTDSSADNESYAPVVRVIPPVGQAANGRRAQKYSSSYQPQTYATYQPQNIAAVYRQYTATSPANLGSVANIANVAHMAGYQAYVNANQDGYSRVVPVASQHYDQMRPALSSSTPSTSASSTSSSSDDSDGDEHVTYGLSFGRPPSMDSIDESASSSSDDEPQAESRFSVPRSIAAQLAASYQEAAAAAAAAADGSLAGIVAGQGKKRIPSSAADSSQDSSDEDR